VNDLCLMPIGSVPAKAVDWIENATAEWFPLPIRRLPALPIPESAYDSKRKQYQSVEMMKLLAQAAPRDAARVLGIVDVDLAIPMLSFLFGQAQFDGPIAVVSLCRLHQEFYGLPAQENLLRERTVKEVLHELGHTFGLVHCSESTCAMSLATHIQLVDSKAERYCERCGMQLVQRFSREG
jgi:archaemetzincin